MKDGQVELGLAAARLRRQRGVGPARRLPARRLQPPVTTLKGLTLLEALVTRNPFQTRVPADGKTFFAVTLRDTAGLESAPSRTPPR
ncbi:MAG: hypothetical protein U1F77_02035 [Kiritimatiellia bacterium]